MVMVPVVVVFSLAVSSCEARRPDPPVPEAVPSVRPPAAEPSSAPPDRRPAQPTEVEPALRRVLPAEVRWTGGADAGVGDFNGDESPDLAVVLRPSDASLPTLNRDPANWIVQDAARNPVPDPKAPDPGRVRLQAGDQVLVVLHGHGPAGWRNPDARQMYVVKLQGPGRFHRIPRTRGTGVSLGGPPQAEVLEEPDGRGFVYWDGASYFRHGMAR
jgi:hypothetical protein